MSTTPPASKAADLSPDTLTRYIYGHFRQLLTEEELAAERVQIGRAKQLGSSDPQGTRSLEFFRVPEVQAKFPGLMRRIDEYGVAFVMRAAAERVLRDNPEKRILHTCPKCGELCRTPVAQQCFECGFDWHPEKSG
jgi:hypothetical protein